MLSAIDQSDYDQLWLFAVDTGDGLDPQDCAAIGRFRRHGRGLLVTRDHMDLGKSVCSLGGVGPAHHFHSKNPEPDESRRVIDDRETAAILWPNYHSGANGDFQEIAPAGTPHPLLHGVRYLPSHPHEGAVDAPPGDPTARVIATGTSTASGRRFNIAVAFEPTTEAGPALAQSTFHHFADFNWNPASGLPQLRQRAARRGPGPRARGGALDPAIRPQLRAVAGRALAGSRVLRSASLFPRVATYRLAGRCRAIGLARPTRCIPLVGRTQPPARSGVQEEAQRPPWQ